MKQLKKGDRGSDVKTLQTKLGLSVDGVFGPITEKAVERFQLDKDIMVTGVVDSNMWVLVLNMEYKIDDSIIEWKCSTTSYKTKSPFASAMPISTCFFFCSLRSSREFILFNLFKYFSSSRDNFISFIIV